MSLPVVPYETIFMDEAERFGVFERCARFQPEHSLSNSDRYAICVGSFDGGTLFASDTLDLRLKFDAWATRERSLWKSRRKK